MSNKTKIIYHKNCMDGIASAFIAKSVLGDDAKTIPLQYGEEQILFGRAKDDALDEPLTKDDAVYFVDFSLKRDLMIELASQVKEIVVLDHHKTAEANLKGLEEELDNVTIIFDMEKSGATLCYDCFEPNLKREIFDYIADRDLWKWQLKSSKEISAYLKLIIKPNDLESFKDAYNWFDRMGYAHRGSILLKHQELQVASKIKKTKDIEIQGIKFKALNATENISEIGNAICENYNTPALMYFITEKDEVVCSLRSIDTLADASVVAQALGGGGHRNACGFTTSIDNFVDIVINNDSKNECDTTEIILNKMGEALISKPTTLKYSDIKIKGTPKKILLDIEDKRNIKRLMKKLDREASENE